MLLKKQTTIISIYSFHHSPETNLGSADEKSAKENLILKPPGKRKRNHQDGVTLGI